VRKKDEGHTRRALAPRERGSDGISASGWTRRAEEWGKDLFWKAHYRAVTGCRCSRKGWLARNMGRWQGCGHENEEATASLT
jgi:hypothetical protein